LLQQLQDIKSFGAVLRLSKGFLVVEGLIRKGFQKFWKKEKKEC